MLIKMSETILHVKSILKNYLEDFEILESAVIFSLVLSIVYASWKAWRLLFYFYQLLFQPSNRIIPLGEIGYINHETYPQSQNQLMKKCRQRRKIVAGLPPVYPNGWYRIMDSNMIKRSEVKQVRAFGQNLLLYRTSSGKACVMESYCAHMGANIAVGGRVIGDCIQCPFHGWKFNSTGDCVEIPYAKTTPKNVKQKTWHSCEVNGQVMVWYHCEGVAPQWEIPIVKDLREKVYCGRTEHHINCHIQDIPENGYDEAHLNHLHLPHVISGCDLSKQFNSFFSWIQNCIKTDYRNLFCEDEKHIATIYLKHEFVLFKKWKIFPVNFVIKQIGPGHVQLSVTFPLGSAKVMQYVSPSDPMDNVLVHTMHLSSRILPMFVGKLILWSTGVQVDRDLMVWNNRVYMDRPILLKEEKTQKTFRRWMKQFYTENSIRYNPNEE